MFEKLLSLILHSKGAVVAGVFVAGAAGMVATGSVAGQSVNLTFQPASNPATANAPTTSSTNQVMATLQQLLSGKPLEQASTTTTGPDCDEAAHQRNAALAAARKVWRDARGDIKLLAADAAGKHLKSSEVKPILETARKAIDEARKTAFDSIQDEFKKVVCAENDEDKNEQKDNDEDKDNDDKSTTAPTTVTTGTTTGTTTATTGTSASKEHEDEDKNEDQDKDKDDAKVALTAAPQVTFDTSKLASQYQAFITTELDSVNKALSTAFTDLSALKPSTSNTDKDKGNDKKDSDKKDSKKGESSKHNSKHSEHSTESHDD